MRPLQPRLPWPRPPPWQPRLLSPVRGRLAKAEDYLPLSTEAVQQLCAWPRLRKTSGPWPCSRRVPPSPTNAEVCISSSAMAKSEPKWARQERRLKGSSSMSDLQIKERTGQQTTEKSYQQHSSTTSSLPQPGT